MRNLQFSGSFVVLLFLSCGGAALDVGGEGTGGGTSGGDGDGDGPTVTIDLPCDVFDAEGHPCVAAHSTVRRLRSSYAGPLYQVCKSSDVEAGPESCQGEALDIGTTGNGYADAGAQEAFCATQVACSITVIYDQSGEGNHLEPAPPGSAKATPADPVAVLALPTLINGRDVYGVLIRPGLGYRAGCNACTHEASPEMPTGDEPQTIYMVTGSEDLVDGCCFNYGNGTVSANNDGNGTAEAVYFGQGVIWGSGSGSGPWVMADQENGLFPGWENGSFSHISTNTPLVHEFVTAIVVGDTAEKNGGKGRFALYGGNAQEGGTSLTTMYDGIRPERPGYVPMQKQGSVVLGIASDNSNGGGGRFYEGAIVKGAASKDTLDAVQAAIVAAKYGE